MKDEKSCSKDYNYGEWGETYALSCILRDHSISLCNNKLETSETQIPIITVQLRTETKHYIYTYNNAIQGWDIRVAQNGSGNGTLSPLTIQKASEIAAKIKLALQTRRSTLDQGFIKNIKKLGLYPDSKSSNTKTDIILKIQDIKCGFDIELGYSIKTFISRNPPTLFNASGDNTIYKYKISGIRKQKFMQIQAQSEEMHNSKKIHNWFTRTIQLLNTNNANFSPYLDTEKALSYNLSYIDLEMDKVLSYLVLIFHTKKITSIEDAVHILKSIDPLKLKNSELYEYKVKKFLVASAFGMTAAKKWDGVEHANGGFIIVTPEYKLIMYQPYNRNDLEEYLYKACKFDKPSSGKCVPLYIIGRDKFIDLAFQIRFKSFTGIQKALSSQP